MENIQVRCSNSISQSAVARAIDGRKDSIVVCIDSVAMPVGVNGNEL